MDKQPSTNPFPPSSRIISTHDSTTGRAVFSDISEKPPIGCSPCSVPGSESSRNVRLYSTNTFPVSGLSPPSDVTAEENANRDLKAYLYELEHPSPPDGSNLSHTLCRIFEIPPEDEGRMHRTISFDYGVVLDGAIEWELDSGEKRIMRKGDVSIQRGTAHAWKNVTPIEENNGWARMFFVILSSEKITIKEGRELGHGVGLPRLADSAKSPY
ncbi:uncharacterized protein TRUGW13939_01512 [Talaromyces rugulosus]|uniref:Cupin 2 conserved barrel domain-containing protein n=1 Tax=Talaromyces rugulosus TaxID=121627 RepID=A0A7H8QKK0_TALRU|nr:uncharacterized protein TRUGW13939_01512 [Talaromyces rugulosus]QKX54426.1 hypothetical protein TRUGW13939_01512 [Talaromyces rugulosus]